MQYNIVITVQYNIIIQYNTMQEHYLFLKDNRMQLHTWYRRGVQYFSMKRWNWWQHNWQGIGYAVMSNWSVC